MSDRLSNLNRRTFEHRIPLDRHQHAQGYESRNSEDPCLAEEAQLLLSQFMKRSSQNSCERSSRKSSDDFVRGNPNFHVREKVKDDKSVNGWEASCIFSGDSRSVSSRDRSDHGTTSHASTVRQQHSGDRTHNLSTGQWPMNNSSNGKRPAKAHLYRRQDSPPSNASVCMTQTGLGNKDQSDNAATFLPNTAERKGSSPVKAAKLRYSDKVEINNAKITRRSRRATSGPANYSTKVEIDDSESDVDRDGGWRSRTAVSSSSSSRDQSTESHIPGQSFIVYSSSDVQIVEKPFHSLNDFCLTHACYAPEPSSVGYAKKFKNKPTQQVLHADFYEEEMSAILKLLSFYGFRWNSCSDIPLTDQVIRVVASMSTRDALRLAADGVSWICELSRLLLKYRANDFESFLLAIMKSEANRDKLGRIQGLVRDILGLDIRSGRRKSFPRCADSERFHQLLNCLTYASKLGRRHRADIEAFLTDAMHGHLATVPRCIQGISTKDGHYSARKTTKKPTNISKLLRSRELGNPVNQRIQTSVSRNLKPSSTWKGASNDVIVLSWSPDGTRFAVGAAAQCDDYNMEYNRGNNLLLGDLTTNSLKELPDHWIPRSSQRAISDQAGTSPRLFMSVTAMQWFENTLFTASYDNTVKLWDVSSHGGAYCFKTLRHQSKVEVMARSNFSKNILATGTDSIGYWDLSERESKYTPLELIRSKKGIELVPTSLAWGSNPATEEFLLAGMSQKDPEDARVPLSGHLGMWRADETSMIPIQLIPNSQGIFDIKWHPSLPAFATASSVPHNKTPGTSKEAKSVVRIYEPLSSRRCTVEFDCPALDINDVTFCPKNPNYVTASCTDGVSYVWDYRSPSDVLLKLTHGEPLNQIDENLTREQTDVGVRLALWGDTADQFYTGSSDGVLKSWNILLSQEDALTEDKASFMEEIMSGAFSEDKSNLLIGDSAGGIHILSSGPFLTEGGPEMNYERAVEPDFKNGPSPDSESGVDISRNLLSSGQLDRHPIYGVGQGPFYKGPFAAWARPKGTPREALPIVPLKEEHRIRQFDGAPVKDRPGLDSRSRDDLAAHMRLARIRNKRRHEHKRKRNTLSGNSKVVYNSDNYIDICSDDEPPPRPLLSTKPRSKRRAHGRVINRVEPEIIDLTGDTDSDDTFDCFVSEEGYYYYPARPSTAGLEVVKGETLADDPHENWEEDFWWPASADIDPNIQDVDV